MKTKCLKKGSMKKIGLTSNYVVLLFFFINIGKLDGKNSNGAPVRLDEKFVTIDCIDSIGPELGTWGLWFFG